MNDTSFLSSLPGARSLTSVIIITNPKAPEVCFFAVAGNKKIVKQKMAQPDRT